SSEAISLALLIPPIGKASGTKNGSVPWTQISGQRSDYITAKYLPEGVKLREPSKLQKKDVIAILEFWRKRQQSDPEDVFSFRKWQDSTGTLQNPVDSDSDQEAAIRRRKASKGKRQATSDDGLTRKRRMGMNLRWRGTIQAVREMTLLKELSIFSGMVLGRQYPSDHRVLVVVVQKTKGRAAVDQVAQEEESDGRSATLGIGPSKNRRQATSDGDDRGPHRWTSVKPEPRPMTSRASNARVSYAGRSSPELNSEEAHPSSKTKSTAAKKTLGQDLKAKKREPQHASADGKDIPTALMTTLIFQDQTQSRRPKDKSYPDEAMGAKRTAGYPEEQPRRSKWSRLMPARFLDASPQPKIRYYFLCLAKTSSMCWMVLEPVMVSAQRVDPRPSLFVFMNCDAIIRNLQNSNRDRSPGERSPSPTAEALKVLMIDWSRSCDNDPEGKMSSNRMAELTVGLGMARGSDGDERDEMSSEAKVNWNAVGIGRVSSSGMEEGDGNLGELLSKMGGVGKRRPV
ncbi:hypothetical protein BU15DRAFT_67708, partial [Melanogaster broomeanus]